MKNNCGLYPLKLGDVHFRFHRALLSAPLSRSPHTSLFHEDDKNEDIMASSPLARTTRRTSCRAITVAVIIGWLAFFVPIQITQKLLFTQQQQLQQHQQQPTKLIKNDERSAANNNNNNNINNNDDYEYAPIIVAAGMGTTGTHLMFDATCAMNIASVHYRLNCHLHAENNTTTTTAAIETNNTRYYQQEDYYKTLLEHHRQLTRMMLTMQDMTSPPAAVTAANNNNNFMTPLQFKQKVLHHLEEIIAWVYHQHHHQEDNNEEGDGGITLALHDAPYPLLISSILKLVQKYFGNKTKPIILLSERNSNEWIARRTMLHGRYTYVCRESIVLDDNHRAISSRSLEGGAFDILGCIDKAAQQQHEQQQLTRDDILYNLKEVQRLNQTQYVVDSMNQYQNAIRDLAVFNYNMFESTKNRTSVEDLVQMIKNAMLEKRITWLL